MSRKQKNIARQPERHPTGKSHGPPVLGGTAQANEITVLTPAHNKRGVIIGLVLVLAVIFAYQPVWNAGFIWDDDVYVTENSLLSAPDGLKRIWFTLDSPSQYFPLTYTVLRLQHMLWGLHPAGYHWVNILLHAANALLVGWLLRRLALPGAWLGAALWALHPVQVESVAWVTELKNVLMCFFFLLSVLAWTRFVKNKSGPKWIYYVLALGLYLLALFSKTTACTIPAALVLVLWLSGERVNRARIIQILPFVVLGLGMGLLTVWWERHRQGTQGDLFAMGIMERILVASRAIWFYAGKLCWPATLTFSYPRWNISDSDPLAYVWLAAAVGVGATLYRIKRQLARNIGIASLFFVSTLSPVLGFIMLYTFLYTFVADHYQYVACLGPLALAAAGIAKLAANLDRRLPRLGLAACGAVLLTLGTLTWRQARIYQNTETLWQDTLNKNPNCWLGYNNLGFFVFTSGRVDEAIALYKRALEINPQHLDTCINLGVALFQKGRTEEAISYYQKAVEISPHEADAHNNLGHALFKVGRVNEAIAHLQKAVEIAPQSLTARNNLAWALATGPVPSLRNGVQAIALAKQSLQLAGGSNPELLGTLAAGYAEAGQFSNAVAAAQQALQLATKQGNQALSTKLYGELGRYQSGLPCHDTPQGATPLPER